MIGDGVGAGDVPPGALGREARRALETLNGYSGTIGGLHSLSSALRAHVGNLAQFGLPDALVEAVVDERASIEVINAVAINNGVSILSGNDRASVSEACDRIRALIARIAEDAK